jgi:hypothetical protein
MVPRYSRAISDELAGKEYTWGLLLFDNYIRIGLIIFEAYIIAGLVFLNEAILQQKGILLSIDYSKLDAMDLSPPYRRYGRRDRFLLK